MNSFEENDLIAYHLHELSAAEERAISHALKLNPELATQSEAIASTLRMFDKTEGIPMVNAAVLDRNWHNVRASLTVLQPRPRFQGWRNFLAVAAIMALLTLATLYAWHQVGTGANSGAAVNELNQPAPSSPGSVLPSLSGSPKKAAKRKGVPGSNPPPAISPSRVADANHGRATAPGSAPAPASPYEAKLLPPIQLPLQLSLLPPTISASKVSDADLLSINSSQAAPFVEPLPPEPSVKPGPQPPPSPPARASKRKPGRPHESDLSVGVFEDITLDRTFSASGGIGPTSYSAGSSQSTDSSVGAVVTFHEQLRPWLGFNISSGYTPTTFNYSYRASNPIGGYSNNGGIRTNVFELSSAYVVQGPHSRRVSSFAQIGGGMLTFLPTDPNQPDSYVYRGAAVAGLGMNYKLNQRWGLRAEYRGVYFKGPDFRYSGSTISIQTRYTLSSEPTVSLTYQFGKKSK